MPCQFHCQRIQGKPVTCMMQAENPNYSSIIGEAFVQQLTGKVSVQTQCEFSITSNNYMDSSIKACLFHNKQSFRFEVLFPSSFCRVSSI